MTREHSARVGSIPVRQTSLDELVRSFGDGTYDGPRHVHFTNAYSVVCAEDDASVMAALSEGACFADGMPLIWALRKLDRSGCWTTRYRVRGPDAFTAILGLTDGSTTAQHFLLGSTPEVLNLLRAQIRKLYPAAQLAGSASPPFAAVDQVDWDEYLAKIAQSGASHVWIGLGTPKQDIVAARLAAADPDRIYLAVGAAFDFLAGVLATAPTWMQRYGLEWAFRLFAEPRRLWRRYLTGNTRFLLIVLRQWLSQLRPDGVRR